MKGLNLSSKASSEGFGKILEKPLSWVLIVLILFAVPLYFSFTSPQPKLPPVLGKIPNFKLTNQEGREVSFETDYRGSVLLVNFIFSSCPDICPMLTRQMAKLQSRLLSSAPYIRLLSISVDPDTDTPEVLKEYGIKHGANFKGWSFLTGDLMQIYDTVVNGFNVAMQNPGYKDPKTLSKDDVTYDLMEITHGEHFVVVDQVGNVRAYLKGNNETELNQIVHVLGLVTNTPPQI